LKKGRSLLEVAYGVENRNIEAYGTYEIPIGGENLA